MAKTRTIIVDDEEAARLIIKQYLSAYPDVEIEAECKNGVEAIAKIDEYQPDLIFLDIQMPGLDGFQVLREIQSIPKIIFSTAYDQYAIKAFDLNAVDYLLKPYTKERFDKAVTKVLERNDVGAMKQLAEQISVSPEQQFPSRILVESLNRLKSISTDTIIYLKADKDYTKIITTSGTYLSTYGISTLEMRLHPSSFMRVHRSNIVNINFIKELYKLGGRNFIVMQNGDEIVLSRSYLEQIRKFMF